MTPETRAALVESQQRAMYPHVLEAFDHRHDGLAAKHRFDGILKQYALLFFNGSICRALAPLVQAEKRIQKERDVKTGAAKRIGELEQQVADLTAQITGRGAA